MSDFVERLAKATYEDWAEILSSVSGKPAVSWDQLGEDIRESYRLQARASVARMIEAQALGMAFGDWAKRKLEEE